MRRRTLLLAIVSVLLAGGCMAKPRHLVYPDGVTITGWHNPNFEVCNWDRDPNDLQPCPLVIHLPTGDLEEKELSDRDALRKAGWEEQANSGNLLLRAEKGQVVCSHQKGVLTAVSISALPSAGGPIAFSVNGKRLSLPATDQDITTALGEPLRRE